MKKAILPLAIPILSLSLFLTACGNTQTGDAKESDIQQTKATANNSEDGKITQQNLWCGGRVGKTGSGLAAYYDSSVSSFYAGVFDSARARWGGISSKVYINKTSSNSGNPDIYTVATASSTGDLGIAIAYRYDSSGSVVAITGHPDVDTNWEFVNVIIYHNSMEANAMDYAQRVSNATHEVGHSLKMAHPKDGLSTSCNGAAPLLAGESSVMNQGIQSIPPQAYDQRELKRKWGQ